MRYELDSDGWVCKVFFGCTSGNCLLYEGKVPTGYTTLEEWATEANIQAYKIVDGNLVYDETRSAELLFAWQLQSKRILWEGLNHMAKGATIELNEKVSTQPNGIVLVWSGYDGTAQNNNWNYTLISKQHIEYANGGGVACDVKGAAFDPVGCKYVYVYDDKLEGNENNNKASTKNGITYSNDQFVLRYVLGI